jgi:hypothetical protein
VIAGLGVLAVLGVLAAGCGDDGGGAAGERTTTTVEPAVTTTTVPEDPWAVPEEIDEAYVQRVLQELYRLDGDALRIAVREGIVTEEVIEIVRSVYVPGELPYRLNELLEGAADGFEGVLRPPGDIAVTADEVVRIRTECLVVRAVHDFGAVSSRGASRLVSFVELFRGPGNGTGWVLGTNSVGPDEAIPEGLECA